MITIRVDTMAEFVARFKVSPDITIRECIERSGVDTILYPRGYLNGVQITPTILNATIRELGYSDERALSLIFDTEKEWIITRLKTVLWQVEHDEFDGGVYEDLEDAKRYFDNMKESFGGK